MDKELENFIEYLHSIKNKKSPFLESSNPERTEVEISFIANKKYFYERTLACAPTPVP